MLISPPPLSKIQRPLQPPNVVERQRLRDQLDAGAARRLTLVCAPAGYGKTTLIADWLERSERLAAWASLDSQDNDLAQFLYGVIVSVQECIPKFGHRTLSLLNGMQQIPSPRSLVLGLVREFDERGSDSEFDGLILVLDDYHLISEPVVHDAVAVLVDYLPPELHLVVSTRIDPPLPISRLRARDELAELRARDLRFTAEETSAFLSSVMLAELAQPDIEALQHRTEGWIASLQLAAVALRSISAPDGAATPDLQRKWHAFVSGFAGTDRYIFDYLMDEVLTRQSEEIQSFLTQSSILDRINAQLCDVALKRTDSASMLRRIERLNLFLVELDNQREWYRYHPLFAELLRVQLDERDPDMKLEISRRATCWLDEHGFVDDAVQQAFSSQDYDRAADIIEADLAVHWDLKDITVRRRWLESLPPAILESSSRLLILRSWFSIQMGWIEAAVDDLQRLDARPEEETAEIAGEIASVRAYVAESRGELDEALRFALLADRRLSEDRPLARAWNSIMLGVAYLDTGKIKKAQGQFQLAADRARQTGEEIIHMRALSLLHQAHFFAGELNMADDIWRQLDGGIFGEHHSDPASTGFYVMSLWTYGMAAYYRNELDTAAQRLRLLLNMPNGWLSHQDDYAMAHAQLAHIEQVRGNRDQALRRMEQAVQLVGQHAHHDWAPAVIAAAQAELWLMQGEIRLAKRWLEETPQNPGPPVDWAKRWIDVVQSHVLLRTNRLDEAIALAVRIQQTTRASGQRITYIQALNCEAIARHRQRQHQQALALLDEAWANARPDRIVRPFLQAMDWAPELSATFSERIESASGRQLMQSQPAPTQIEEESRYGLFVEPLTERELEILELLMTGQSSPEIAEVLFIGVTTVRTHLKNLYRKLDVHSRYEATVRARELGII